MGIWRLASLFPIWHCCLSPLQRLLLARKVVTCRLPTPSNGTHTHTDRKRDRQTGRQNVDSAKPKISTLNRRRQMAAGSRYRSAFGLYSYFSLPCVCVCVCVCQNGNKCASQKLVSGKCFKERETGKEGRGGREMIAFIRVAGWLENWSRVARNPSKQPSNQERKKERMKERT